MSSRILIVGSLNIDMILKIDRMPETGKISCPSIYHATRRKRK